MFDFNPVPGAVKKWFEGGRLVLVALAFRKRRKRGRNAKSKTVVRFMTPDEYHKSLTKHQGKR